MEELKKSNQRESRFMCFVFSSVVKSEERCEQVQSTRPKGTKVYVTYLEGLIFSTSLIGKED